MLATVIRSGGFTPAELLLAIVILAVAADIGASIIIAQLFPRRRKDEHE